MGVGGEGREKKLADIDRCEQQAAKLVQQATAVPLGLVRPFEGPHNPLAPLALAATC